MGFIGMTLCVLPKQQEWKGNKEKNNKKTGQYNKLDNETNKWNKITYITVFAVWQKGSWDQREIQTSLAGRVWSSERFQVALVLTAKLYRCKSKESATCVQRISSHKVTSHLGGVCVWDGKRERSWLSGRTNVLEQHNNGLKDHFD